MQVSFFPADMCHRLFYIFHSTCSFLSRYQRQTEPKISQKNRIPSTYVRIIILHKNHIVVVRIFRRRDTIDASERCVRTKRSGRRASERAKETRRKKINIIRKNTKKIPTRNSARTAATESLGRSTLGETRRGGEPFVAAAEAFMAAPDARPITQSRAPPPGLRAPGSHLSRSARCVTARAEIDSPPTRWRRRPTPPWRAFVVVVVCHRHRSAERRRRRQTFLLHALSGKRTRMRAGLPNNMRSSLATESTSKRRTKRN